MHLLRLVGLCCEIDWSSLPGGGQSRWSSPSCPRKKITQKSIQKSTQKSTQKISQTTEEGEDLNEVQEKVQARPQ